MMDGHDPLRTARRDQTDAGRARSKVARDKVGLKASRLASISGHAGSATEQRPRTTQKGSRAEPHPSGGWSPRSSARHRLPGSVGAIGWDSFGGQRQACEILCSGHALLLILDIPFRPWQRRVLLLYEPVGNLVWCCGTLTHMYVSSIVFNL